MECPVSSHSYSSILVFFSLLKSTHVFKGQCLPCPCVLTSPILSRDNEESKQQTQQPIAGVHPFTFQHRVLYAACWALSLVLDFWRKCRRPSIPSRPYLSIRMCLLSALLKQNPVYLTQRYCKGLEILAFGAILGKILAFGASLGFKSDFLI